MMNNKKKMELYLHIPFCAEKCAYCDFLSFRSLEDTRKAYTKKMVEEIKYQAEIYQEYEVCSLFIGGGTPSILEPVYMSEILDTLERSFMIEPEAEFTIEANPGTLTPDKLNLYRQFGLNRISLGLQSANDQELRDLNRIHSYDSFLKSYERARRAGFQNINVDLMSAIPGQTMDSWKSTLKKIIMLKPEHISAYSLILEEGTPFYERYKLGNGQVFPPLPDEETEKEMYDFTADYLMKHGYTAYEISNYAKAGYECKHNIGYWTGVSYLGIGLGASSYMEGCRFHNERDLETYLSKSFEELLYKEKEQLTIEDTIEECMFLGLRLTRGVSQNEFTTRTGHNLWNIYEDKICVLQAGGFLEIEDGFIRLTKKGRDIGNYVMGQFLLDDWERQKIKQ